MTDAEILELRITIARDVMGWEQHPEFNCCFSPPFNKGDGRVGIFCCRHENHIGTPNPPIPWRPDRDANQALEVAAAAWPMEDDGYQFVHTGWLEDDRRWTVEWGAEDKSYTQGPSLQVAICEAARKYKEQPA